MTTDIDNTKDVIDVRDLIEAVEAIPENWPKIEDLDISGMEDEEIAEYEKANALRDLLEDLRGNGGDEQWMGDWYPLTLIRESYFTDYARELAEDIGAISNDAQWPNTCIDWEEAADQLKVDYSEVEFDGVTYYYR